MKHDEIIQKVRDILNEHGGDNELNITTDRVLLDEYIECAIPDAVIILAQRGFRVNPKTQNTRNPKTQETGNPKTQNTGNAVVEEPGNDIKLPDDFVSLIYVKLGQWKRKVTRVTEVGSPEYNMAMNVYTAPGINTPMCYKEGDTLICLPDKPVKSDDTPAVEGDDTPTVESVDTFIMEYNAEYKQPTEANAVALTASPKEAAAVCYMTAALVMGMFGDDQGKQRLSDISTNMLQ
jgi:hypothetical protein